MTAGLQELQAASSPSRRVGSPFSARRSPLREADARRSPPASPRARALAGKSPGSGSSSGGCNSPRVRAFSSNSPTQGSSMEGNSNSPRATVFANNSPAQGPSAQGVSNSPRGNTHTPADPATTLRTLNSRIARISQRFEQATQGMTAWDCRALGCTAFKLYGISSPCRPSQAHFLHCHSPNHRLVCLVTAALWWFMLHACQEGLG